MDNDLEFEPKTLMNNVDGFYPLLSITMGCLTMSVHPMWMTDDGHPEMTLTIAAEPSSRRKFIEQKMDISYVKRMLEVANVLSDLACSVSDPDTE